MKTLNGLVIVIPTYGRVERQITLRELPVALHPFVWLAATKDEAPILRARYDTRNVLVQPPRVRTIHQKRHWIMSTVDAPKVMMLDDDMFWQARGPKGLIKEYATPQAIYNAMGEISELLDDYAHAGFSSRMGNNRVAERHKLTTRMMHSLGYNVAAFHRAKARFDRVHGKEDFDVTLQLLRRGYNNIVVYHTCVSPGSYSAPGGCSLERTIDTANQNAKRLAELHPGFVRVVERRYKNHPRLEVMMSWKKAYAEGCAKYGPQKP